MCGFNSSLNKRVYMCGFNSSLNKRVYMCGFNSSLNKRVSFTASISHYMYIPYSLISTVFLFFL